MRSLKILHVEDSEEDLILFRTACETAGLQAEFYRVRDGTEAIAYLKGGGEYTDRGDHPLPDLIVLDLKMPGMDGFDFLRWLRRDGEQFAHLPVLIFTVSLNEEDKKRAATEGATGYFLKPKAFDALVKLAESLRKFSRDN